jgi:hypothetical protein
VFFRDNPIDSWVLSNTVVSWVNNNNLEEFVGGILSDPVGVEDSHVGALSSYLLLSDRSVGSSLLELSNTLVDWLTSDNTSVYCSLSSSSSDSNSVDNVSLFLLESEGSSLIESRWSLDLMDDRELSILPTSDSHDESDDIRLLLSPQFLQVLIGSQRFVA